MLYTSEGSRRQTHKNNALHLAEMIVLRKINKGLRTSLMSVFCWLLCFYSIIIDVDKTYSDMYVDVVKVVKLLGYSNFLSYSSVVR